MGPEQGELLVVSWGGTYGSVVQAAEQARAEGLSVSVAHLRYLNPFPPNLEEVLGRFAKVIVPELNRGQLHLLLKAKYLLDAISLSKVQGLPFRVDELLDAFRSQLGGK